jgi:hypothetical protein
VRWLGLWLSRCLEVNGRCFLSVYSGSAVLTLRFGSNDCSRNLIGWWEVVLNLFVVEGRI